MSRLLCIMRWPARKIHVVTRKLRGWKEGEERGKEWRGTEERKEREIRRVPSLSYERER